MLARASLIGAKNRPSDPSTREPERALPVGIGTQVRERHPRRGDGILHDRVIAQESTELPLQIPAARLRTSEPPVVPGLRLENSWNNRVRVSPKVR